MVNEKEHVIVNPTKFIWNFPHEDFVKLSPFPRALKSLKTT